MRVRPGVQVRINILQVKKNIIEYIGFTKKIFHFHKKIIIFFSREIAAASHDADGEDNADREDSPEHIYHQIGTDEVVRVSKSKSKNTNNSQSPASGGGQAGSKLPTTASTAVLDSDKIIITKNSVSRRPRTNLSQGRKKIVEYMGRFH